MSEIYLWSVLLTDSHVDHAFAFQNSGTVNLSLLFTQITLPMSVLIVMIYFLGMFTGGLLITLLRALMRNMTQKQIKV
ncbi:hypothetical protein A8M56_04045 [Yersinia pestis]|nr:hypothetical protein A8M56_04045 [Yersinia pestis]